MKNKRKSSADSSGPVQPGRRSKKTGREAKKSDRLPKPEERIKEAAEKLFYRQGYSVTGINTVLQEAGAHKQSLYLHFESKEDLGRAYIDLQGRRISELLRAITGRRDPARMVKTWVEILKRQARSGEFYGCPLGNFSAQTLGQREAFQDGIIAQFGEWLSILEAYFEQARQAGYMKRDARSTARQLLMIYEGNTQLYLITRDTTWLDRIRTDFMELCYD